MAMIAISESTALVASRREAKIGRSTETKRGRPAPAPVPCGTRSRVSAKKLTTGSATVPMTPIGCGSKILIASQVSRQSPRSMVGTSIAICTSIANRVAGQLEKDVLERRDLRTKIDHRHSMLCHTLNHVGDEIVAVTADHEVRPVANDRLDLEKRPKAVRCGRMPGHDHHRSLGTVPWHELGGQARMRDAAAR